MWSSTSLIRISAVKIKMLLYFRHKLLNDSFQMKFDYLSIVWKILRLICE